MHTLTHPHNQDVVTWQHHFKVNRCCKKVLYKETVGVSVRWQLFSEADSFLCCESFAIWLEVSVLLEADGIVFYRRRHLLVLQGYKQQFNCLAAVYYGWIYILCVENCIRGRLCRRLQYVCHIYIFTKGIINQSLQRKQCDVLCKGLYEND